MSDKIEYENEYSIECDCGVGSITGCKQNTPEKAKIKVFSDCPVCGKKKKAKEVKKSIYKNGVLVPVPIIEDII